MTDSTGFAEADLALHRSYLVRYALGQLRNREAAEEVVQETLLAALESRAGFAGKSTLRTWLTAILKHKIVDAQRREIRSPIVDLAGDGDEGEADFDTLFDRSGHWREMAPAWANPEQSLENRRFWEAFEYCLDHLPGPTARAFYLREIHGLETEAICKELAITSSNCWVMLHRARMSLRECLAMRWFGRAG